MRPDLPKLALRHTLSHSLCVSETFFKLMHGKLRAESARFLVWMLRIGAFYTPHKHTEAPLTKTQGLQLRLLVLAGSLRLLGSISVFGP